MSKEKNSQAQKIKDQIETWDNRAKMARQQNNEELAQQALERKRKYENALAQLQEFELDD